MLTDIPIDRAFGGLTGQRVLVVGDLGVVEHDRETPSQARQARREVAGAARIATSAVLVGARVAVAGMIGDDEEGEWLVKRLRVFEIDCSRIVVEPGRKTWVERRYFDPAPSSFAAEDALAATDQSRFRRPILRALHAIRRISRAATGRKVLDSGMPPPIGGGISTEPVAAPGDSRRRDSLAGIAGFEAVVLADYGRGANVAAVGRMRDKPFEDRTIPWIVYLAAKGAPEAYRGATLVAVDAGELGRWTGLDCQQLPAAMQAADAVRQSYDFQSVLVCLPQHNTYWRSDTMRNVRFPRTAARFDREAAIAACAVSLAAGETESTAHLWARVAGEES